MRLCLFQLVKDFQPRVIVHSDVGKAYIDHLHQQRLQYLDTKKKDKLQKRGLEAKDKRVLFVLVTVGRE